MSSFGYDVLGFGSSATTGVVLPSDDEFNTVSFLSHFDGANNGVNNVFDDGSASNHTITANGSVTQGSFGPFARPDGEWGVAFDGSGDRVRANWTDVIESVAFTIEAWVFIPSDMDQYDCIAWLQEATHGGDGDNGFFIRANNSNTIEFAVLSGSTKYNTISSAISFGEWHHLSLSKSGTTMYSSVDGTVTSRSAPSSINNSKYLNIGAADANGSVSYPFNGFISNVRFLKGTALYTSNFTVPTSPLTVITNTKFLGCQSNRFVDNSSNDYTITPAGNPSVSAFGPFLTSEVYDPAVNGASLFVTAQGDYLSFSTAGTPLQTPSTFTAEGWVLLTQAPGSGLATGIISCGNNGVDSGSNSWSLEVRDDLKPRIVSSGYTAETAQGTAMGLNEWCHVAMTYDGTTWSLYQNGVRSATSTTQTLSGTTHSQGYVGRAFYADARFAANAYFSDVRMVTSLLYTDSTYTVPTAPLTAITNTQLLLNMADGQAIDSAAQNNMTLLGNTKLSTTQAKFGDTSMLFATSEADKLDLGDVFWTNSDWTHEFWIYLNSNSTATRIIFTQYTGQVVDGRCVIQYINSTGKIMWFIGISGANITMDVAMSKGAWHHVALTRSGNDYKLFVDGTAGSTGSSSQDLESSVNTILGPSGFSTSGQGIDGFIDDLRFSKFVRYTNNFTPPTEPFADKGQE